MKESTKETLSVQVAPSTLLKIWLGDGNISTVSEAISLLGQEKTGSRVVIKNLEYIKDGNTIKLIGFKGGKEKMVQEKAAALLVTLTALLSNKSAKEISTMAA